MIHIIIFDILKFIENIYPAKKVTENRHYIQSEVKRLIMKTKRITQTNEINDRDKVIKNIKLIKSDSKIIEDLLFTRKTV